jgi:cyclopropane-fatty-acyl-phospholipid synthase
MNIGTVLTSIGGGYVRQRCQVDTPVVRAGLYSKDLTIRGTKPMTVADYGIALAERGLLPDALSSWGIRAICQERLDEQRAKGIPAKEANAAFAQYLSTQPLAICTDAANEQHYEVPAEFYSLVLGKHRKYSSCFYQSPTTTLAEAEEAMLNLYAERGQFRDGQKILELGCGWGSLCLYLAERFPNSTVLGVSNSNSQREYITTQATKRGLRNLSIVTADINDFSPIESSGGVPPQFDRVVSIEMFEHLRNYQELFKRINSWLAADGKMFVHIFCHRDYAYEYQTEGSTKWMGRYFFTGGQMPSRDLFSFFNQHLTIEQQWDVSGVHYERTARDWLKNMDDHRTQIDEILAQVYGAQAVTVWRNRWRLFFLACAELFGFKDGREWMVEHYLFSKK